MIGGDVGGIPLQIVDGESGFLVSSPEQAAERSIEILEDPGPRQVPRPRRQGAHPRALPDPAPAARLAADVRNARFVAAAAGLVETFAWPTASPDHRLQPRSRRVRAGRARDSHRQARRRRAGDGAERPRQAPPGAVDRVGDERRGRGGRDQRRRRARRDRARRRLLRRLPGRERPGRLRPLLQRDREPDPVVHPALPVGPLERAGHPPDRGRGVGERLQGRQLGHRRPGGEVDRGPDGARS